VQFDICSGINFTAIESESAVSKHLSQWNIRSFKQYI